MSERENGKLFIFIMDDAILQEAAVDAALREAAPVLAALEASPEGSDAHEAALGRLVDLAIEFQSPERSAVGRVIVRRRAGRQWRRNVLELSVRHDLKVGLMQI